jgi:hypothetical protein
MERTMRDRLDMTLALVSFYSRVVWVLGAAIYEPLATRGETTQEELSWLSRRIAAAGAAKHRI